MTRPSLAIASNLAHTLNCNQPHQPADRSSPLRRPLLLLAILAVTTGSAQAGPLRDRIRERWQANHAQELEADEANGAAVLPSGVRLLRDIAYGQDERQRFDVYLPPNPVKDAPVLFMVHGGAWMVGNKSAQAVVENKVARWVPRGFIFVSINYRLLPKARPLDQAGDVARALAAAQDKAAGWGGDRNRFILMGHSAGAHLVSLLAAAPDLARQAGASPWRGTVALDSAAYDLVSIMGDKHYGFYDRAFGTDPAYWQAASPQYRLQAPGTPFLAVCSAIRPDQPCRQARDFVRKAQSLGQKAEVLEQSLSHRDINQRLGEKPDYTQAVETFMASVDGNAARLLDAR